MNLGQGLIDFRLTGVDGALFSTNSIDIEKKIVVFFVSAQRCS